MRARTQYHEGTQPLSTVLSNLIVPLEMPTQTCQVESTWPSTNVLPAPQLRPAPITLSQDTIEVDAHLSSFHGQQIPMSTLQPFHSNTFNSNPALYGGGTVDAFAQMPLQPQVTDGISELNLWNCIAEPASSFNIQLEPMVNVNASMPSTQLQNTLDAVASMHQPIASHFEVARNIQVDMGQPAAASSFSPTGGMVQPPHQPHTNKRGPNRAGRRRRAMYPRLYMCTIHGCGQTFTLEKDLERHQLHTQAHRNHVQQPPSEDWPFLCAEASCRDFGRVFSRADNYRRHVRTLHKK